MALTRAGAPECGTGEPSGTVPMHQRRGCKPEAIRFAVGRSSMGAVLVGSSHAGVVAILIGDDQDALICDLQKRFPRARLVADDLAGKAVVAAAVGAVETPRSAFDLPLDIRGSHFQLRVWQALRSIPAGRTISYAALAASVGAPSATRAVAGACAANKVAVVIPCHRVVRSDGSHSGYAWGIDRKRTLLQRERDSSPLAGSG